MNFSPTQHEQLVKTARAWVGQTFYGEMLKQMRESPFRSKLFEGGRGGEAFEAQLDQKLSERMSNSRSGERLVQSIVKKIEGNKRPTHVQTTDRA
jgi:Rod binding domain-containing protein